MLKKSLYILSCATILSASTTMCYKKNHIDPSSIEIIALDGGKCDGKLSVVDMKKDGYQVDTIKIQNTNNDDRFNYIYVFKKDDIIKQVDTSISISNDILKVQLKQIKKDEKKQKKIDDNKLSIEDGKKIYKLHCVRCHGENANIEAYGSAKALNSLTLEDMEISIRDYRLDKKDNGMAILMKPYSEMIGSSDTQKIYNYIQTLK